MARNIGARKDHSQAKTNNPTKAIESAYSALMAETDPTKLAADVVALVESTGGVSPKNLERFKITIRNIGDDLRKLQGYITNFYLAGCGLSVS